MTTSSAQASTAELKQQVFTRQRKSQKKSSGPAASKIVAYVGAFLLLIGIVAIGYDSPQKVSGQVAQVTEPTDNSAFTSDNAPSVDEVVATGIAADLAERANLPIASNAANMSVSLAAKSELAQTDTTAITKPQIIKPSSSSRAITTYVAQAGDSVPSIASKFGISENTVRWANGLTDTDAVEPGRKLTILPVSGILHTIGSGESVAEIANKFNTTSSRIVTYNDLELSGAKAGQRIIVPGGVKVATPVAVAQVPVSTGGSTGGSVVSSGMLSASVGNRYAFGNCTYYAYERRAQLGRPVGSFWGNGGSWAYSARAAGYPVNNTPKAGAVFVEAGSPGHVGVVERVKANGDVVVTEMNNYAYGGFNIVNERTISAGQALYYTYIH